MDYWKICLGQYRENDKNWHAYHTAAKAAVSEKEFRFWLRQARYANDWTCKLIDITYAN